MSKSSKNIWKEEGAPAINRAAFSLNETSKALRVALNSGDAVDSLLIIPFIKRAVELNNDIQAFINAKSE